MEHVDRQAQEPEIYLQSFELSKLVLQSTPLFPKPSRYVLGKALEERILNFLLLLNRLIGPSGIRFQSGEGKRRTLEELSFLLDEFRILLRLCRETGVYSAGQYKDFNERTQSIGRQLGGMLRSEKERRS